MSNHCPYCDSENFENEATPNNPEQTQWVNKCRGGCGKFSVYDEATDTQIELEEPRKSNG